MSDWISVNGWRDFQHYDPAKRGGLPRWIKVYTRLLQDDDYLDLTEHCALILHRLWLEYASSSCRLRADTRELSRRLAVRVTKSHLETLNHAGFIDIVASKSLAEGYQVVSKIASPETEEETEEPPQGSDVSASSNGTTPSEPPASPETTPAHVCDASTSESELCGASFDTLRALAIHRHDAHGLSVQTPDDVEQLRQTWEVPT